MRTVLLLQDRLRATTSFTAAGPVVSKPFGTPATIAIRYEQASQPELHAALQTFCVNTGLSALDAIKDLSLANIRQHHLDEFRQHLPRLALTGHEDTLGRALRRFDAAQQLHTVLEAPLVSGKTYPKFVRDVLEAGADGLFEIGQDQFLALRRLGLQVVTWIEERQFRRVVVLESPHGNSVPCQVIGDMAKAKGLNVEVVEWGFPRNDRTTRGQTLTDGAKAFAALPKVEAADCILFIDDALTGTRFLKLAKALRKALGPERVHAIAMGFRYNSAAGKMPFNRRNLDDARNWAKGTGLPGIVEFPAMPLFRADEGGPVLYESAVAWADHDVVAGKRKVNLVFNLIDVFERIFAELCQPRSPARSALIALWSKDSANNWSLFSPGVMDGYWDRIAGDVPLSFHPAATRVLGLVTPRSVG